MILYINCCARKESRTDFLARSVLERLGGEFTELKLYDVMPSPLTEENIRKRDLALKTGDFSDPFFELSKQFASADEIVISCPFWDYSFPSVFKNYIENVFVMGIVARFDESGILKGMCRAKHLIYVTTSGGEFVPDFSYEYIKRLSVEVFGVEKTLLVKAEMLDVSGQNPASVIEGAVGSLDSLINDFCAEDGSKL